MGKDSVAVRIAGHEYKIRSDGDVDALREIAGYVDRAMERVRERTGTVDTLDVAVLTCLNLAREIMALHEEQVPAGSTVVVENKLRSLIERVETSLGGVAAISEEVSEAASDAGHADEASETGTSPEAPRTLDLRGVEALRDRTAARNNEIEASAAAAEEALPEARVAAGGRERAS